MQFSDFAHRYQANSGTLQLMEDLGQANTSDQPVYMLGGGNPSHIPAMEERFQQEMLSIANDEQRFSHMVGNYDGPQGDAQFINDLAALLNEEFGWPVSEQNITLTNGSQSSFGLIFNLLAGRYADGSFRKILLPITPEYIGYTDVGLHDHPIFEARHPTIELLDDGFFKYHIDFNGLVIDDHIGAVCLSRPTNPTGNVVSDEELQHLSTLCREAEVPLIIDGAYGLPFPSILFSDATPIWDNNTILCLSLSKLGLPGVRTGIVIADVPLINLIRSANAINSLAPGSVGPNLVGGMLRSGELIKLSREVINPYYRQKMRATVAIIQSEMQLKSPGIPVRIHAPEGALFLWLWFEGLPVSSEELYQRLKQQGVYVIAGNHFFPGLDDKGWKHQWECIRVSYAGTEETVAMGLKIIAETVREIVADS